MTPQLRAAAIPSTASPDRLIAASRCRRLRTYRFESSLLGILPKPVFVVNALELLATIRSTYQLRTSCCASWAHGTMGKVSGTTAQVCTPPWFGRSLRRTLPSPDRTRMPPGGSRLDAANRDPRPSDFQRRVKFRTTTCKSQIFDKLRKRMTKNIKPV